MVLFVHLGKKFFETCPFSEMIMASQHWGATSQFTATGLTCGLNARDNLPNSGHHKAHHCEPVNHDRHERRPLTHHASFPSFHVAAPRF
jgi:hypothetical protein